MKERLPEQPRQVNQMTDERVTELLQHAGETDERGNPTRRAQVAALIRPHLVEIEKLESKLALSSTETFEIEDKARVLAAKLAEESGRTTDLMYEAQDEVVRNVLTDPPGDPVAAPLSDKDRRRWLRDFESNLAREHQRLDSIRSQLRDKRKEVDRTRELMTRRLNILNSLIDSVSDQDNTSATTADAQSPGARGHARRSAINPSHPTRRPRRVRVVRRRAS